MTWIKNALWAFLWFIIQILLCVIGFVLFIIVLPFFIIPVRYKVKANLGGETSALVRVSYLFGLIGYIFEHSNGESTTQLRIAWFKPGAKAKSRKMKTPKKPDPPRASKSKIFTRNKNREPSPKSEKPKSKGILKSAKAVLTYPNRKIIMNMVIEALRRTGRVLWPKHLNITGEVGFPDPMHTGLFIGAYEALAGAFGLRRKVCILGDFTAESMVVRLNIYARGSISVARLSIPIIWLLLKKPIRTLIKDIRRKGDS